MRKVRLRLTQNLKKWAFHCVFYRWRLLQAAIFLMLCLSGFGYYWLYHSLGAVVLPEISYARQLLDKDKEPLAYEISSDEIWRLPVSVTEIDPLYLNLLIDYEDRRFYQHNGVDWYALMRAMGQFVSSGKVVSGGSTLTMQTAKMLNPRPRTVTAKLQEMRFALALEKQLSKLEILELYLTLAPFGGNVESVSMASYIWFGKKPSYLTPAEAALLVALPQSPERRRPDRFPENAENARNRVLERALGNGSISQELYQIAILSPVPTKRISLPKLARHLLSHPDFKEQQQVTTSIDGALQGAVENLLKNYPIARQLNGAVLIIDGETGRVRAYLGSQDYYDEKRHGAFDFVRAIRSPGSTLKPFIYGLAMDQNLIHPETIIQDEATNFEGYRPENISRSFLGDVTVTQALRFSLNIPVVKVLKKYGVKKFQSDLTSIGVPLEGGDGLPVALGGAGIDLWRLAKLYTSLTQKGDVLEVALTGAELPVKRQSFLKARTASSLNWILAGTGSASTRLSPLAASRQIAYKTGTGPGGSDALAIGTNGRDIVAVWVGSISGAKVAGLTGYQIAAPIMFQIFDLLPMATLPAIKPERVPLQLRHFEQKGLLQQSELQINFPTMGTSFVKDKDIVRFPIDVKEAAYPLLVFVNGDYWAELSRPHSMLEFTSKGDYEILLIDRKGRQAKLMIQVQED